jgi:hypothetical protein
MWLRCKWILISTTVIFSASACESIKEVTKEVCNFKCGKLSEGEVTISGSPQVDGFFKALYNLDLATASIEDQFKADVHAIAEAYGVDKAKVDAAFINKVAAAVNAEYQAKLVGGKPQTIYQPAVCEASLDVAVQASAECKVEGGCQVDVECKGGEFTMTCEGQCSGSCKGTCSVPVCEIELSAEAKCSAECHGRCEATVTGQCQGTCRGTCSGQCTAYDGVGKCMGQCSGECSGTCDVNVEGTCGGVCRGRCVARGSAAANCQGTLGCEGSCQGECSGRCEGRIDAPRCSTDAKCDVEARCEAQASAQASASLECRPSKLDILYQFKPEVTAKGQAEFFAKLAVLEEHMGSISLGYAQLGIFITGDDKLGIKPFIPSLLAEIQKVAEAAAKGEIKVNSVRLPCLAPAVQEAATMLGSLPGRLDVTFKGQATMMSLIKN